jgi:hypothetical protein
LAKEPERERERESRREGERDREIEKKEREKRERGKAHRSRESTNRINTPTQSEEGEEAMASDDEGDSEHGDVATEVVTHRKSWDGALPRSPLLDI